MENVTVRKDSPLQRDYHKADKNDKDDDDEFLRSHLMLKMTVSVFNSFTQSKK